VQTGRVLELLAVPERMIQGIQNVAEKNMTDRSAALRSVLSGFGEQDIHLTAADSEEMTIEDDPRVRSRGFPAVFW
jgi:hypothetical protein